MDNEYILALLEWQAAVARWVASEVTSQVGGGVHTDSGGNGPPPPPPPHK